MNKVESATTKVFGSTTLSPGAHSDFKNFAYEDEAGTFLHDARVLQGLDIATLAGLLKVPVHKLQALEQGRLEALPDPMFTRALAASICRVLKLDPVPVLQKLPAITAFKEIPQNRGINTPFRTPRGRHVASVWSHISKSVMWLGLVMGTSALALNFFPVIEQEFARLWHLGDMDTNLFKVAQPAPAATTVVTSVSRNNGAPGVENLAVSSLSASEVTVAVGGSAMLPTPLLPLIGENATLEPMIMFTAKSASAVKIVDGSGAIVFNRVLRAGESASLSGILPLSIMVGRASAVRVQVRGEVFDLGVVSKNNIARFEIKQ